MKQDTKEAIWITLFFIALIIGGFLFIRYNDPIRSKIREYKTAFHLCGEGNVQKTDYSDGSVKFTCADYTKAK